MRVFTLDDEGDRLSDGAERAERFHAEEVAGVKSAPVASEESHPRPLFGSFRCRYEASFGEDVGDGGATYLELRIRSTNP